MHWMTRVFLTSPIIEVAVAGVSIFVLFGVTALLLSWAGEDIREDEERDE